MTIYASSILVWAVAIFVASFSVILFFGRGNLSSRVFAIGAGVFSIWATIIGIFNSITEPHLGSFIGNFAYFLGTMIISAFLVFFRVFPNEEGVSKNIYYSVIIIETLFLLLYFKTDWLLGDFIYNDALKFWTWTVKPPSILFDFFFFQVFVLGTIGLYRHYLVEPDFQKKRNLKYMIITIIVGALPTGIFDMSLHWFGVFKYNWVGPISGIFWVMILGYSILKYQQMDVRLAFSEMFVVAMNVIFLINIFLNFSLNIYGRVALAVVFFAIGYFLIKLLIKENDQREQLVTLNSKLSDLNQNLEAKVEAQTEEVRKAYEIEKKANENLKKLDQNKNDFIIVTQHHLRTPISQIRWYLDSIQNGLYGPISRDVTDAVSNVSKVTDKLSKVLGHFLDIAQLKVGNKIFSMSQANLKNIIESVVYETRQDQKKNSIVVDVGEIDWPELNCDQEKIKDVFLIVLDNAIRYGKSGSTISITGVRKKDRFNLKIISFGVKLSPIDLASIMKDSFYRSDEAKKLNPTGMGVSLLVAKTIMMAHKGGISITATKEGGAEVNLEFKL